MFKVNNKDTRTTPLAIGVVLVPLLLTLNKFHTLFQHVIASWVMFISQETASIQNPR